MSQPEQGSKQTIQLWEAARAEEPGLKTELLKKIRAGEASRSPARLAAELCLSAEDLDAKSVPIIRAIILYDRQVEFTQKEFTAGRQLKQKLEREYYPREFKNELFLYSSVNPFYNDLHRQAFVTLGQAGLETIIGRFAGTIDHDDSLMRVIAFEALLDLDKLAHTATYMDNPPDIVTKAMAIMEAETVPEDKQEMWTLLTYHLLALDTMDERGSLSGYDYAQLAQFCQSIALLEDQP